MKKSLIIVGLLTVLALAGVIGVSVSVTAQAEQVSLTEEVFLGEKGYAEGIAFQLNSQWNNKLLWKIHANIGEQTVTDTVFSFHPKGLEYDYDIKSEVSLIYHMNFGYGSSGDMLDRETEKLPYKEVFQDVAYRTKAGEAHTEIVKLADYYEYYDFQLHFRNNQYLSRFASSAMDDNHHISQVLGIRIPEEMLFEATVHKNEDGEVYSVDGNDVESKIRIYSGGTVLKDGCYLYVYGMNEAGLMPGLSDTGYGIYKLPFYQSKWGKEEITDVCVGEFGLVYPLEERMLALSADPQEEELFLLIDRDKKLILQRIDRDSFTLLQEFSLGIARGSGIQECRHMEVTEEGVFILTGDGSIFYTEKKGEGYEMTVGINLSEYPFYRENAGCDYAYDYKDGRLAVIWRDGYQYIASNSVYVLVLEGAEMKFLAHYQNSLDHIGGNYDYSNRPHEAEPFAIWFAE